MRAAWGACPAPRALRTLGRWRARRTRRQSGAAGKEQRAHWRCRLGGDQRRAPPGPGGGGVGHTPAAARGAGRALGVTARLPASAGVAAEASDPEPPGCGLSKPVSIPSRRRPGVGKGGEGRDRPAAKQRAARGARPQLRRRRVGRIGCGGRWVGKGCRWPSLGGAGWGMGAFGRHIPTPLPPPAPHRRRRRCRSLRCARPSCSCWPWPSAPRCEGRDGDGMEVQGGKGAGQHPLSVVRAQAAPQRMRRCCTRHASTRRALDHVQQRVEQLAHQLLCPIHVQEQQAALDLRGACTSRWATSTARLQHPRRRPPPLHTQTTSPTAHTPGQWSPAQTR